jgi:N-acetylneuraminic acid mutarotase
VVAFGAVVLAVACSGTESTSAGAAGTPGSSAAAGTGATSATGGSAGAGTGGIAPSAGIGGRTGAGGIVGDPPFFAGRGGGAGVGGSAAGVSGAGGSGGLNAAGGPSGGTGGNDPSGGQGGDGVLTGTPVEDALMELPRSRQEHNVVAAAGKIYVIAGYETMGGTGLQVTDSVMAYDPGSDSWADVASFPVPMNHANAGVVNDKIYVAGFYINGMTEATAQTFEYDPGMDEWTEKAPLPAGTERGAACVAVDGGHLYVIGGARNGMSVASASRYDAAADTWETLPDLPEQREHCTAGAIDGVIYVAGGREGSISNIQDTTWAFDPVQAMWLEKAPLMPSRGGLAGGVLGGRLFVFGGEGNPAAGTNGIFDSIDAYDPGANTWEKIGVMDVPRHGYGAGVMDGKIYLPGGAIRQGGAAAANVSVFYLE